MYKKDLVAAITQKLRDENKRKSVHLKKTIFHITDEDGNEADFAVRQQDKQVIYTNEDVANMLDALMDVVVEAIKDGETIELRGFGTLGLFRRAARKMRNVHTGDFFDLPSQDSIKFQPGYALRMAVKLHNLLEGEKSLDEPLILFEDGDIDGD